MTIVKKALNLSAFFVLLLLLNTAYADCRSNQYDEVATVKRVIDGDTLVLKNNRKIRIIGINTPELGHYPKQAEPLAINAKQFVETTLSQNKKIKLKYGKQNKDRYGRLLAHVFLMDGRNLAVMLLKKGLAMAIVVPPNSLFSNCYFKLEAQSREYTLKKGASIWKHPFFKHKEANTINHKMTGFSLIKGKVIRVGRSRDSIWLQLAAKFTIRIKRKDFKYFKNIKLENLNKRQLKNKNLYIRGWVYQWKKELYIQLRHPRMIEGLSF